MTFPPEVWDGVLRRLQARVAPISFNRWLSEIDAAPVGEVLELRCPTQFHRDRIHEYFLTSIEECICEEFGQRVSIRLEVVSSKPAKASKTSETEKSLPESVREAAHHQSAPSPTIGRKSAMLRSVGRRAPLGSEERSRETVALNQVIGATMSGLSLTPVERQSPGLVEAGQSHTEVISASGAAAAQAVESPESLPHRGDNANTEAAAIPTSIPPADQTPNRNAPRRNRQSKAPHEKAFAAATPHQRFRQAVFPLTFRTFEVGSCNALAREAAFAIASQKNLSLNQLFLTSGSGLGKTHLARAVALETKRLLGERSRYVTAESFTNEFTHALRSGQMERFKRKYRNDCDLLVFEDIQFLAGKDATQLEFFHTVQHVLDCGGRVLLTGDRFPQELENLDRRVRSRIASGFVAELELPDETVRRNILRSKAARGGLRLPDDCLDILAGSVEGSVRELEGALIQLVTMASLLKRPIDLELTRQSMQGRAPRPKAPEMRATPDDLIKVVASFFKTNPEALAAKTRRRDVMLPRQLAMYLCRRYTEASLAEIGKSFDRDHPSVANAIRKVERQVLENVRLRYQLESLIGRLDELGFVPLHSFD